MLAAVYNCSVKRGSDEDLINIVSGLPFSSWTGVTATIQLRDRGGSETSTVRSQFVIGSGISVGIVDGTGSLRATFSSNASAPNTSVLPIDEAKGYQEYDYDLLIVDAGGKRLYYLEGVCTIRKRVTVPA